MKIGFIGFGLIGGSLAKIFHYYHPDYIQIAYNYRQTTNPQLLQAKEDGVLHAISNHLKKDFADCDIIFLCSPVLTNIKYLKELKDIISPSCIITDVGSVKGSIQEAASLLNMEENFIGGHPMAGSEKTGYENASLSLFENAYYIFCPTKKTPEDRLLILKNLIRDTKAIPILLDPNRHDFITATISHGPHIIAAALVNAVKKIDEKNGECAVLAAGGFRDITRIASSSPVMWQNICLTNKESILPFLDTYIAELETVKTLLMQESEEKLLQFFSDSKEYRDSLPLKKSGVLPETYELLLYIPDRAGTIAEIASLLAEKEINIKDIGIVHNREYTDGVLRVELWDKVALEKARSCLIQKNYKVYE